MKAAAISVNLDNPAEYSIDVFENPINPIAYAHAFIEEARGNTPNRQWTVVADQEACNARTNQLMKSFGLEPE